MKKQIHRAWEKKMKYIVKGEMSCKEYVLQHAK